MTRAALQPVSSWNPDVHPERPGYCVHDETRDVFACAPDKATAGATILGGYPPLHVGWTGPRGAVRVWSSLDEARIAAGRLKGVVTTVPRDMGVCDAWVWERVEG